MILRKLIKEEQELLNVSYQTAFPLLSIVQEITQKGGKAYLIGGAVRDCILQRSVKDLDIEVHALSLEQLEAILQSFGSVNYVGKSFGVLHLDSLPVDWSLPRTDKSGRKPQVAIDPCMDIVEALRRRDLTMNAMAVDILRQELLDPFGGEEDMRKKVLRSPDPRFFQEDPLRFFRVMQSIGRFEMYPDSELQAICSSMPINTVSRERIEEEFKKLFLGSLRPSLGIRWLADIKRLVEILPELAVLQQIEQEPTWHPEGSVFEHTMQTIDAAVHEFSEYDNFHKLVGIYAGLCHDLGKAVTTKKINGRIRSFNHAQAGVPLSKKLLARITRNQLLVSMVSLLVEYHMVPVEWIKNNAKPTAYKKLAAKLAPQVNLLMLALLAQADKRGRNPQAHSPLPDPIAQVQEFINKAREFGVLHAPEPPLVQGKDLLKYIQAGPALGAAVSAAYTIQLERDIHDKEELIAHVLNSLQ